MIFREEHTRVKQELSRLTDAIKAGISIPTVALEAHKLEARRAEIAARIAQSKRTASAKLTVAQLRDSREWITNQVFNAGNRLSLTQKDGAGTGTGTTAGTYDSANKLQSYGNTAYTWDFNGNQTAKTTNGVIQTMVWDYENNMVQLHDGVNLTFSYSADGLRRSKTVNGTTTRFLYDGVRLIAETDDAGNFTRYYDLAPIGRTWYPLIAQTDSPGAPSRATHAFTFDALGTTRALTASDETVSATFTDDAWGNVLAATDASATVYRYVGRLGYYSDLVTSLSLLTRRYYDPTIGQFASADSARHRFNWLSYTSQRPSLKIDPSGRQEIEGQDQSVNGDGVGNVSQGDGPPGQTGGDDQNGGQDGEGYLGVPQALGGPEVEPPGDTTGSGEPEPSDEREPGDEPEVYGTPQVAGPGHAE